MGYGVGRFDSIYFINLKHREDRLSHIVNEIHNIGADWVKVQRIEAVYNKYFGILGCGKSHILALETFIKSGVGSNCLILEDDFKFTQDKYKTNEIIERFFEEKGNDFDVFMLSCNTILDEKVKDINNDTELYRILEGQTLSGYCVSRKYASTLLENFKEGVSMLEKLGYGDHEHCVDIHVKKLQKKDNWYYTKPVLGCQIESYSDIQYSVKNYGL